MSVRDNPVYAVHVLVWDSQTTAIFRWAVWKHIAEALDPIFALTPDTPAIRSFQASENSSRWLPFGRMTWNPKHNQKWSEKYLSVDPQVEFWSTEIWSPSWTAWIRENRTPAVYVKVEGFPMGDALQALTIAVIEPVHAQHSGIVHTAVSQVLALVPGARHHFGRTPWAESVWEFGVTNALPDRTARRLMTQLPLLDA